MSLVELWNSSRQQIENKHVQQLIAVAGQGELHDDSTASREFREFLTNVSPDRLRRYANECLESKSSGLALQDVVNEIGRRLDYKVTNGRYRGTTSATAIDFDGLWRAPEGHEVVVEVKTSVDFRIKLDTVTRYRKELISRGEIDEDHSSILFIVGRGDTSDLEAQIRGSRHAWDIRLISVSALLRLLSVREDLEDPESAKGIRSILVPREYTRVDGIIDLVFSAKEDILQEDLEEEEGDEGEKKFTPVAFHDACVERIQNHLDQSFIKRSRATFLSPDESVALICVVSKEHESGTRPGYWFAFHPHQKERLEEAAQGYVAFGCGSEETVILLPVEEFEPLLNKLHQTHRDDGRSYWHVIIERHGDRYFLHPKAEADRVDLTSYLVKE